MQNSFAQGCSDAGVCSIDGYAPSILDTTREYKSTIRFGANYGRADHSITAIGAYLSYGIKINDKWDASVKAAMLSQADSSISAFGLSDIYVNTTYHFFPSFSMNLGFKVPLMDASKSLDGLPLPMDFQSSLGTFDLLIGFRYQYRFLQLMAGYQQPLTQNKNAFLSELYPDSHQFSTYQSTNQFVRSPDAIFRAAFVLGLAQKLYFTPSALFLPWSCGTGCWLRYSRASFKFRLSQFLLKNSLIARALI